MSLTCQTIKEWAIKRLGGYTKADVEQLRAMCKSMADEFGKGLDPLVLRGGEHIRDLSVVGSLYVLGDYVFVHGCAFWTDGSAPPLKVAPTSKGIVLSHNIVQGPMT